MGFLRCCSACNKPNAALALNLLGHSQAIVHCPPVSGKGAIKSCTVCSCFRSSCSQSPMVVITYNRAGRWHCHCGAEGIARNSCKNNPKNTHLGLVRTDNGAQIITIQFYDSSRKKHLTQGGRLNREVLRSQVKPVERQKKYQR